MMSREITQPFNYINIKYDRGIKRRNFGSVFCQPVDFFVRLLSSKLGNDAAQSNDYAILFVKPILPIVCCQRFAIF